MFLQQSIRSFLNDAFFILTGVMLAAFGLEGFLMPNSFIDGGVTGICLLVREMTGVSLPILLLGINFPFLFLAYRVIGPNFAAKTALAILALALAIQFIHFPVLTDDKLLISVFGGFLLGTGIGMSMRGGSVLDGTEVLAIFLSRHSNAKVSDWVILINIVIFGGAAMVLSLEQAMYSLLTYFVASKALDFIIDGVEEFTGATIMSPQTEEIRQAIINQLGVGVTLFRGRGGYGSSGPTEDKDIIYVVITRLEIRKLTLIIQGIDPNAFITMSSINDVQGGMLRKRGVEH